MEDNKKKDVSSYILALIILILVIIIAIAIYLGVVYKGTKDEIKELQSKYDATIEEKKNEIEQLKQEHQKELELIEQEHKNDIAKIKAYYEEKIKSANKTSNIKRKIDINNDLYYDELNLHVGDIYNVMGKENSMVAFCSVISGKYPKVGDICHLEAEEDGYVYEAIIYEIEESSNLDGSELLFVYFEGVKEDDLKFTPKIRRLK